MPERASLPRAAASDDDSSDIVEHACRRREGLTYELEVRLLSRDERHDGQLYGSLPCAREFDDFRVEGKKAEISKPSLKVVEFSSLWGHE